MRVLYLAHRIPYPPNKGDKLRAFHQIARLAKCHEVWCACFIDNAAEGRFVESLGEHCREVHSVYLGARKAKWRGVRALLNGQTVTEAYFNHPEMRETIQRLSGQIDFDVVVAFSSSMAPYALSVPAQRRVLDLCDLDSEKWLAYAKESYPPMKWVYRAEGRRLAVMERRWLGEFDATILITEAEAEAIDRPADLDRLHIVGNGVPLPDESTLSKRSGEKRYVVGFVGQMDYKPNVDAMRWFVECVWPGVRVGHPCAEFRIVGRSPVKAVRNLSAVEGVRVVGEVRDVGQELVKFDVSVAPIRIARGLQNKVLEAMAYKKPIVLTPAAAEGIAAHGGLQYLLASQADDFAASVVRLLRDQALADTLGRRARRFVATHHRWEDELAKFEAVVTGTMSPGKRVMAEAPRMIGENRADCHESDAVTCSR